MLFCTLQLFWVSRIRIFDISLQPSCCGSDEFASLTLETLKTDLLFWNYAQETCRIAYIHFCIAFTHLLSLCLKCVALETFRDCFWTSIPNFSYFDSLETLAQHVSYHISWKWTCCSFVNSHVTIETDTLKTMVVPHKHFEWQRNCYFFHIVRIWI